MSLIKRIYRPSFFFCRYCAVAATVPSNTIQDVATESVKPPSAISDRPLTTPALDNDPTKEYSAKIVSLVDHISQLTLLEVADLNELLKVKLGLPDVAMAAPVAAAAAPASSTESATEDASSEKAEKLVFNVKLVKFDPENKVKLIKEVKSLIEGMNLVQAKKFVEGAPQMIMNDISKEEAEKIKERVESAGGTVEIE